jgi:hypothetical protein
MTTKAALYGSYSIYFLLALCAVVLAVASVINRHTAFILAHPIKFIIETIVITFGASLALVALFRFTRGISIKKSVAWVSILAAKLFVFHLLLELSGSYSYILGTF